MCDKHCKKSTNFGLELMIDANTFREGVNNNITYLLSYLAVSSHIEYRIQS